MSRRSEAVKREAHYRRLLSLRERHPEQRVGAFCREHGISVWTYYQWRKRLKNTSDLGSSQPSFVPVDYSGQQFAAVPSCAMPALGVELAFPGGLLARLPRGYSREELLMVVAAGRSE